MPKIELYLRQRKVPIKRHTLQRNRWLRRQLGRGALRGLPMRGALTSSKRACLRVALLAGLLVQWPNGQVNLYCISCKQARCWPGNRCAGFVRGSIERQYCSHSRTEILKNQLLLLFGLVWFSQLRTIYLYIYINR